MSSMPTSEHEEPTINDAAPTDANVPNGPAEEPFFEPGDDIPPDTADAAADEAPAADTSGDDANPPATGADEATGGDSDADDGDDGDDQHLIDLAASVGFSEDDIDGLSEAQVRRMVAKVDEQIIGLSRSHQGGDAQAPAQQPAQQQRQAPAATQQPSPANETAAPFELKLPDDIDPDIAASFKGMADALAQERARVDQMAQQYQSAEDARMQAARVEENRLLDDFFGSRDPELYGEGELAKLTSVDAANRRNEVYATAITIADGLRRIGKDLPPAKTLLERAEMAVHGEKIIQKARQQERTQIAGSLKDRSGRTIGRGGAKRSARNAASTAAQMAGSARSDLDEALIPDNW